MVRVVSAEWVLRQGGCRPGGLGIIGVASAVLFMVILPGGGSGFDVGIPQLPGVNLAEQATARRADPAGRRS